MQLKVNFTTLVKIHLQFYLRRTVFPPNFKLLFHENKDSNPPNIHDNSQAGITICTYLFKFCKLAQFLFQEKKYIHRFPLRILQNRNITNKTKAFSQLHSHLPFLSLTLRILCILRRTIPYIWILPVKWKYILCT